MNLLPNKMGSSKDCEKESLSYESWGEGYFGSMHLSSAKQLPDVRKVSSIQKLDHIQEGEMPSP